MASVKLGRSTCPTMRSQPRQPMPLPLSYSTSNCLVATTQGIMATLPPEIITEQTLLGLVQVISKLASIEVTHKACLVTIRPHCEHRERSFGRIDRRRAHGRWLFLRICLFATIVPLVVVLLLGRSLSWGDGVLPLVFTTRCMSRGGKKHQDIQQSH